MKKSVLLSSVLLLSAISACAAIRLSERVSPQSVAQNSPASPMPTPTFVLDAPSPRTLEVGEFNFEELNTVTESGCGMYLWQPTNERVPKKFVFFNGLEGEGMWMKLDGKLVKFQRVTTSGGEFYGQTINQTFYNEDKTLRVEVSVELGAMGEIESTAISSGMLRVEREGNVVELAIVGNAGC